MSQPDGVYFNFFLQPRSGVHSSRPLSPLPTTVRAFVFMSRMIQHFCFLSSWTLNSVELGSGGPPTVPVEYNIAISPQCRGNRLGRLGFSVLTRYNINSPIPNSAEVP